MPVVLTWPVVIPDTSGGGGGAGPPPPVPIGTGSDCSDALLTSAKNAMFLDTAVGADLNRLGAMFLVPRPDEITDSDSIYRQMIQLLAFSPKSVLKMVYDLLGILFGTQAALENLSVRPWRVYEVVTNEILVEIPLALTTAGLPNATYLHGLGADGNGYTTGAADHFFVNGDDFTKGASSFVGLILTVGNGGVLTNHTIVSLSYNPSTRVNTFVVSAATLTINTVGFDWRVLIPDTVSYLGDYFINSAAVSESTVNSNIIVLYGDGLIDIFESAMLNIVKASGIMLRVERI